MGGTAEPLRELHKWDYRWGFGEVGMNLEEVSYRVERSLSVTIFAA